MRKPRAVVSTSGLRVCLPMLALIVAGCGGIPTSGPIKQGAAVGTDPVSNSIRVLASPPRPGMDPVEIVRGFLDASASTEGNFATARSYLSSAAAASWAPSRISVVDSYAVALKRAGADRVLGTGALIGRVDEAGSLERVKPVPYSKFFHVVREGGEWRISDPPPALLLSRADLDRGYRSHPVYFFDPQLRSLVPDIRWFANGGLRDAVAVTRAVLAGPSEWIGPAVQTVVPGGTRLTLDSVPVQGGIASVDLTRDALGASDDDRLRMAAQIVWTLTDLPDITGVIITVNGQPFPMGPEVPSIMDAGTWSRYDPDVLAPPIPSAVLDEGTPRSLNAGSSVSISDVDDGRWREMALGLDGSTVAGVDEAGRRVQRRSYQGTAQTVIRGKDLHSLSFDRDGGVWAISEGRIYRSSVTGVESQIPAFGLPRGATVVALSVARDATRIALIVRDATGARQLMLARLVRKSGAFSVEEARRFEDQIEQPTDVAWADADTIAVLAATTGLQPGVLTVDVDSNNVRSLSAPGGPLSIAAAPNRQVLLAAQGNQVWGYQAQQWQPISKGSSPVYPG